MFALWPMGTMGNMIRRWEEEKREVRAFPVSADWLHSSPADSDAVGGPLAYSLPPWLHLSSLPLAPSGLGKVRKTLLFAPRFYNIPGDFAAPCHSAMTSSFISFLTCPNLKALSVLWLIHSLVLELLDCVLCHNPDELRWKRSSW